MFSGGETTDLLHICLIPLDNLVVIMYVLCFLAQIVFADRVGLTIKLSLLLALARNAAKIP